MKEKKNICVKKKENLFITNLSLSFLFYFILKYNSRKDHV